MKSNTNPKIKPKTNPKKWIAAVCLPVKGNLCRWQPLGYYSGVNQAKKAIQEAAETKDVIAYVTLKDGKSDKIAARLNKTLREQLEGKS